jgi:hypothetical protein
VAERLAETERRAQAAPEGEARTRGGSGAPGRGPRLVGGGTEGRLGRAGVAGLAGWLTAWASMNEVESAGRALEAP